MNYYVLFVMGGSEEKVRNFLNAKCSSWNVIFPMIERIHKKAGIEKVCLKPMFPSYLFVRTEMDSKEFKEELFHLKGQLSGIIRELEYDHDSIPALLDDEIHFLERILDDQYCLTISKGYIEEDVLHVTSGALVGLESYISHVNRHKKMATLTGIRRERIVHVKVALEIVDKS